MSANKSPNVVILDDPDRVAERAVDFIVEAATNAIRDRGRFVIALAGGSTPAKAYGVLAESARANRIDWHRVFAFFGDERMVAPDDPRSNLGMARRALLDRVPIPATNVFPVPTDALSAGEAALKYELTISSVFGLPVGGPPPRFDLILLGLGDDGHTASLFPGKPALDEQTAWVTASEPGVLPPPLDRVTLTFPVLNAARTVVFLVTGEKKAGVLSEVVAGREYPAVRVRPVEGELVWLVDEGAGRRIDPGTLRTGHSRS